MNKPNKKTITYIVIAIILVIAIYYYFTKEDYIESNSNLNIILETNEENNKTEDKSSNTKENTKEKIVIYITGAIKNAGVYEMEENSRIADIIEKAGGLTEEANIENINLAYILEDGMRIHIPKKNESINEVKDDTNTYITRENSIVENFKNDNNQNERVNINIATQTELETLPGIGPSIALKIVEYRKENGKFTSIEDIKNVSGIGDSKFEKIKDLIKT